MADSQPPLTWDDAHHWVELGLITPEQLDALKHYSATRHAPVVQPRLNLLTIAYYFGAFIILLAYTFFMGLQWELLGVAGQLTITALTMGGLIGIGMLLRRLRVELASNLLLFAAVGITPLLVYTVQRALGFWPDESLAYQDSYRVIQQRWLVMELVSIGAALVGLWRTRFPLMLLLVSFWSWYFSMDAVRWVIGSTDWSWGIAERGVALVVGAALLGVGLALHKRFTKDYSFWLILFGNLIIFTHLSSLAFELGGMAALAYFVVSVGAVVASVPLQRRTLLIFGALGCYSYVSYLAFTVFDGGLGFTFALAAIGLFIVLSAVLYQKIIHGAFVRRFASVPV